MEFVLWKELRISLSVQRLRPVTSPVQTGHYKAINLTGIVLAHKNLCNVCRCGELKPVKKKKKK